MLPSANLNSSILVNAQYLSRTIKLGTNPLAEWKNETVHDIENWKAYTLKKTVSERNGKT